MPPSTDTAVPTLDLAPADGSNPARRRGLLGYLLAPFRDIDERAVYKAARRAAEAAERKR